MADAIVLGLVALGLWKLGEIGAWLTIAILTSLPQSWQDRIERLVLGRNLGKE